MASTCSEGLKLRPPTSRVDEGAGAGRTPREPRLQQNGTNLQLIANASWPSPDFSFPDPPRIATNCKSLTRRQDRIVLSRFAIDCKFRSSGTCLREGDLSGFSTPGGAAFPEAAGQSLAHPAISRTD